MPAAANKIAGFTPEEVADVESPELTDDELATLRPALEALSPKLYAALTERKPGQRGPQKAPTKEMITIRIDRDVLTAFRATGAGWQVRVNAALRAALVQTAIKKGRPDCAPGLPPRKRLPRKEREE